MNLEAYERLRECPTPQVETLVRISRSLPRSTWHFARCGCCLCVHPNGDPSYGWVVGADGSAEWVPHEAAE